MSQLSCKSCDRSIEGAALACAACGALHHEGCHRVAGHCAVCASAKGAVELSIGGRERARSAALLAASLALVALAGTVVFAPRPTPPAPVLAARAAPVAQVAGRYAGTIQGNDPRVTAQLDLRQVANELDGELVWSSPNSGRNVRRVRGHLEPERGLVILRDIEMPVAEATGGWRFCPVDYYLLDARGDALTGTYWSAECSDKARMSLRRIR